VEYVERLSATCKVRNGTGKWLHRQVCHDLLPKNILRRKKRGFAVNVVDDWFRGAMGSAMEKVFRDSESLIYQYLRPSAVQELLQQHQSGNNDNHKVLFSLVVFEEWLRAHRSLVPSECVS